MASGCNKVFLLGNLGNAPDMRATANGTPVLNFRLATSERVKRGESWEDHTEWHNIVVWGKRAEGLSRILDKGSTVMIEGKLRTREWEKDGAKRYTTEIHVDDLFLASGGRREVPKSGGDDW
jgi:single-strand DNA-binding protein